MTREDTLLDQQIHDAYERIELSDEVQDRMLAKLLAAQAARSDADGTTPPEAGGGASDARAAEPTAAQVIPLSHRRNGWKVWLPVAAAVALALVVVQASGLAGAKRADVAMTTTMEASDKAAAEAADDDAGASEDVAREESAQELVSLDAAPLASAENGAASAAEGATTAELYPRVTLADATVLTTLDADGMPTQVDDADVGVHVCSAVAASADSHGMVGCELFELEGEPGGYAVRYEGEQAYWRCQPVQ